MILLIVLYLLLLVVIGMFARLFLSCQHRIVTIKRLGHLKAAQCEVCGKRLTKF